MKAKLLCLMASLLIAGVAGAGDGNDDWVNPPDARTADRPGGMRGREALEKKVEWMLDRVAEREPERAEELRRLRNENPEQFRQEIRGELGKVMRRKRAERGDGDAPRGEGAEAIRVGDKGMGQRLLRKLRDGDPEQFEQMKKLFHDDPELFRQKARALLRDQDHADRGEDDNAMREQERRTRELVGTFRAAQSDEERDAIRAELATQLAEIFDHKLALQEQRMQELEGKLETMRQYALKRREARQQIIDRRLDELLRDPGLRW